MKLSGLIIASGLSKRMGRLKPLLDYNGVPFLIHIISKLFTVCENIVVVTGYKWDKVISKAEEFFDDENLYHRLINASLPPLPNDYKSKIRFTINPEFEKGMFTSLQTGVNALETTEWLLYHFIDQPQIPTEFYEKFTENIQNSSAANWIQPKHNSRNGHPILLHNTLFNEILNRDAPKGLRTISELDVVIKQFYNCKYEEILFDIDTPEDYQLLKKTC